MKYLFRFLSARHAHKHLLRTFLTVSGVALGVAVVIAIQTVNHSILESFRRMIDAIAGRATLQVSSGDAGVSEDLWQTLEKNKVVRYVTPVVQRIVRAPNLANETLLLMGIDFTGDEEFRDYQYSEDSASVDDPLAFLNDPEATLISEELAHRFQKKVGDFVSVKMPGGNRTLRIRGLLKAEGPARAFGGNFLVMDLFAAQSLFGKEGRFDRYDIITQEKVTVAEAMKQLKKDLGANYKVEIPRARGDSAQAMLVSFQTGLNMGGFVALLVGLFLIYNTMQIAVTQRRKEISISKALGAKRGDVIRLFVGEALIVGAVASLIGIGLGLWLGKAMLTNVSAAVSIHFLKVRADTIDIDPWVLVFGLFLGIGSSFVAALGPARTAASISPVEGLRFEGTVETYQPKWTSLNSWVAYLLSVAGCVLWVASIHLPSLLWGYGSQLAFCLAFAFLAPTLLVNAWRWLRWIPERFFPPTERLAYEQLPRQAIRAAVTLSAIMMGFAMVVEIDNYIFSLKRTLYTWVNQAIPADLFVTSGAKLARLDNRPMKPDLERTFRTWPEVEDIDKIRLLETEVDGVPVPLLAYDPKISLKHVHRDFIRGSRDEVIRRLQIEPTAIVAENFANRFHRSIGDRLQLLTPSGRISFEIVAIAEDYTSDRGIIIIGRDQYIQLFKDDLVDSYDIYLKDKSKAEDVRRRILSLQNDDLDLFALTNQEMKQEIFRIVDETYTVVKVMEVIAVAVSILGIVNTILASVLERRRMLGVLRALGATRRQITRMVMAEGAYLAFGGMALGTLLGILLTEIVFIGIVPKATGWTFAIQIPWVRLFFVSCIGLILSTFAAYLPARHSSRLDIVGAIEYE